MGVSGQHHAPATLYSREIILGTGGRVGFRAGLDTGARGKSFASAGDRTAVIQPVFRHYTELPVNHFNSLPSKICIYQ
jgi:hypothetical protein